MVSFLPFEENTRISEGFLYLFPNRTLQMLQCLQGLGFCFPTVFRNEKLGFGDGNGV